MKSGRQRGPATLDHVAIAVPSIERFLEDQEALYGHFRRGAPIVNARQGVKELFLEHEHAKIELLEPLGDASPIGSFLRRHPFGGPIHLALCVDDLRAELSAIALAGGTILVGPVPDLAFGGREIAFVALGGQVTELIQRGDG